MGLIYSSGDSSNLMRTLSSNLSVAKSTVNDLKSGSQRVVSAVDGRTLSGAAYNAGKGLFSEVILPTIGRVTTSMESVQNDLATYTRADAAISSEGYLDEDKLNQQMKLMKASKATLTASAKTFGTLAAGNPVPGLKELLKHTQNRLNRGSMQDDIDKVQKKMPTHLPTSYPVEETLQRLANLQHVEVEKNAIPEAIDFLELYNVKAVDELNSGTRWTKADTSKSLAVPLGVRGKDDIVYLNLHERAHGPHGLVAGTTGSGKSEIVQSYILSLAVNFAPEDVGFLPIDFKGGGMANLFADLPHLLGSITNLDGASSARALQSIRVELQKRQRKFSQFGVNHINGYTNQRLYKII